MTSARIAAAYDRIAADYAVRNAAMSESLLDLGNRFLALLGSTAHILEVGCGPGRDMAWLESGGGLVTGIDLSIGMLAQARIRVRGPLLQMSMDRLAFATGQFDGVWCIASLLHLAKTEAPGAVREMRRVLRPGGVLALSIQEGDGEVWESGPYGHVERLFARYAPEEAEALLASAGFAIHERGRNGAVRPGWIEFLAIAS